MELEDFGVDDVGHVYADLGGVFVAEGVELVLADDGNKVEGYESDAVGVFDFVVIFERVNEGGHEYGDEAFGCGEDEEDEGNEEELEFLVEKEELKKVPKSHLRWGKG